MLVTIEIDVPEQTVRQYEDAGIDWKALARQIIEKGLIADAPSPLNQEPEVAFRHTKTITEKKEAEA